VNINDYIQQKFGSKRGMLRFFYFQCLLRVGYFRRYQNIDFSKITRLVFVCTGNICRSPVAEAAVKRKGVKSYSFGLDTRGDADADPRAIDYAKKNQIELSEHRTKTLANYSQEPGDLLVVMEPHHITMLPAKLHQLPITLAGLWLQNPVAYLHDPYNTVLEYFDKCERLVQIAAENIAAELIKNGR
jgi:protein-tyrosine phosphatase